MHSRVAMFVITALVTAFSVLPAAASAQESSGGALVVPITGTTNGRGTDVPLEGQFTIQHFRRTTAGEIEAIGTAVFQIADAETELVRTIVRQIASQVDLSTLVEASAQCPILLFEIPGGVQLDPLGLTVELDPIRLEIAAEPGNLLGNLLCAITGLLDSGGPVQQLVAQLNNLLRILG